jgi:dTDP-4-dehydrorhamnose reductase
MRVLVTGKDGQLGRCLAERAEQMPQSQLSFVFAGRDRIDLANPAMFKSVLGDIAPDIIINAAAYTAVDKAEDEPDLAMKVNAAGPGALAEAAMSRGGRFVQISTDYVFKGDKNGLYTELDPIDPQGAYGQSKAAGEMRVREAGDAHVILRTAWVYSPYGQNFPKTMLRLAGDRDELNVVQDQYGNPTSALDLADGLIAMCNYWLKAPKMGLGRTYHLAGTGETNWANLAREVFARSAAVGGPTAKVNGIPSSAYPTKAKRPANSRLDSGLFRETFGYRAPPWQDSVRDVVTRLIQEG